MTSMNGCELQASGAIELYFYEELNASERAEIERHVSACAECRRAVEELSTIRTALATRPRVEAPPGNDWGAFMARLDEAIRFEGRARTARVVSMPRPPGVRRAAGYASYLAMAAVATLVTSAVVYYGRAGTGPERATETHVADRAPALVTAPTASTERSPQAAFAALSEQHFERSKLVVLGLANKDPKSASEADWAFERGLASNLLSDTRLYRMAAEERGMKTLAGVMGDLELVLLQTSLAEAPDPTALAQIQRLIQKRNLVTKMDVASTGL
jgi:hypothetical protein